MESEQESELLSERKRPKLSARQKLAPLPTKKEGIAINKKQA